MALIPGGEPRSGDAKIAEERARAALRRAAELQVEAAERRERADRGRRGADVDLPAATGFRPGDLAAAAEEVGIARQYIEQALLEQEVLGEHAADLPPWIDRLGDDWLRTRQRSIEVARTMDVSGADVLAAIQRIFPARPYELLLVDTVGGRPLEGGVLIFQTPRITAMSSTYTPFAYTMTTIDLLQIYLSIRPIDGDQGGACEVTIRGDLRVGIRRNVWAGLALSGGLGVVGAGAAGLIAAAATAGVLPIVGAAIAGLAVAGAPSALGYGAVYRHYLHKAHAELQLLLRLVNASARTGGGFPTPGSLPAEGRALPDPGQASG